jgi:hypothetical protein
MLISDVISYSMRISGVLGVGQTPLPQDTADGLLALRMMLTQWRQKRWIVFRIDNVIFPLVWGKQTYTIGSSTVNPLPEIAVPGSWRPANIQSCFLRQNVGSGPNSYPIDFPMRILPSRQSYDQLSLKFLQSWPSAIYYDPTIPNGTLYIWPVPVQELFSLYIAYQQAIDAPAFIEPDTSADTDDYLPQETNEAIVYNLALRLAINYKLPPDPALGQAAKASLNTLRQANFALRTLEMPSALRGTGRLKNPMGGFYPEVAAGVPYTVLS